ncbi:MAG: hypothetical protein BMS9Abin26_2052 [Gammaproteobacteria bacterium]|nr:MAG: hypothetical protein BMS9Abin26_2052 [Gammaproteobacteria bacterium]
MSTAFSDHKKGILFISGVLGLMMIYSSVNAAEDVQALKNEIEILRQEMAELRKLVKQQVQQVRATNKQDMAKLRKDVAQTTDVHSEWKGANSAVHLAGYGTVGYTDQESSDGSFNTLSFNPIFHYQYKDLFMLEAELEIETEGDGGTAVELEYASIDWLINDYVALVAGKFLSPLGQFRQNIHPGWVNKLASAPPGFGHDGAAPLSELGVQLRGGYMFENHMRTNYAFYVGNGPELESEDGEVHGITAEAFRRDADGNPVWGGRVGFLPVANFEIGVSGATGKARVTTDEALGLIASDPARSYSAFGVDMVYTRKALNLRYEYIRQRVANKSASVIAPMGGTWRAWYAQAAYRFPSTKWEAVARYTDYNSPHAGQEQEQVAAGVNYWFAGNAVAKVTYESNSGLSGTTTDRDRFLVQLSYGF